MANTGAILPGTGANLTGVGTIAWNNPGNITLNDGSSASFSYNTTSEISNYLRGSNFGFSIPLGATIDGIIVTIEKQSPASGSVSDNIVRLYIGSSVVGTNKAIAGGPGIWSNGGITSNYGSSSDLWGLTPSISEINNSSFGAVISGTGNAADGGTGNIDHMSITVYYTGGSVTVNSGMMAFF
jgi:hypothetical protein